MVDNAPSFRDMPYHVRHTQVADVCAVDLKFDAGVASHSIHRLWGRSSSNCRVDELYTKLYASTISLPPTEERKRCFEINGGNDDTILLRATNNTTRLTASSFAAIYN